MMTNFQNFIQTIARMQWSDYLDIFVVALLIYSILPLLRTPNVLKIARTVGALVLVAWLTGVMELHTINWILSRMLEIGLLAFVILFQPELRRMLDQMGNVKFKSLFTAEKTVQEMETVITQTVAACETMSKSRVGALIVFQREVHLEEYMKTGTIIDAQVSEQLIRNIFFPLAALHDGAMVIREGRVASAGCVLPLSDSNRLSADLGTRHRAGVGVSEVSDAVVIIVSEETGAISVAVGGMLKRHLAPQMLERLLRGELIHEDNKKEDNLVLLLKQKLHKKGKEDSDAQK